MAATVTLIGNLVVTRWQAENALQQERMKAQSELIIEAIKTGDIEHAVTNLEFFIKLGFIEDAHGNIKQYLTSRRNVPVLPSGLEQAMNTYSLPDIVTRILDAVGATEAQRKLRIVETSDPDVQAFAEWNPSEGPTITINREFLYSLNRSEKKNWASVYVLAHEIGHIILRHGGSESQTHELAADEFAAYVCRKLGATLDDVTNVVLKTSTPEGTDVYPPRAAQMEATSRGWHRGGLH